ncbi:hypothetical protein B5X24_HaOG204562 [Helicoverpa armigera]|nr:hypothetical protein B5X24_HaOG204562 [Helicoverpa armigera]
MKACFLLLTVLFYSHFVICRDFYLGMFKKNDFLVAQDVIYKPASHFGATTASYGRLFKCPITYFRVVDRLGMGRGPFTTVTRGGLRKKFITVRIKSTYNLPISVNIYVGCANDLPKTTRRIRVTTVQTTVAAKNDSQGGSDATGGNKTEEGGGGGAESGNGTAADDTATILPATTPVAEAA